MTQFELQTFPEQRCVGSVIPRANNAAPSAGTLPVYRPGKSSLISPLRLGLAHLDQMSLSW